MPHIEGILVHQYVLQNSYIPSSMSEKSIVIYTPQTLNKGNVSQLRQLQNQNQPQNPNSTLTFTHACTATHIIEI